MAAVEDSVPPLADIGANLTHSSFRHDLDAVIARAHAAGVAWMVVTGASREGSAQALHLARAYPETLRATAGIHPHEASSYGPETARDLAILGAAPEVVAFGEMGLDYNRNYSPQPRQAEVFEAQLEAAADQGKPLFLHQRDAHADFLAILKPWRHRFPAAVAHCFTGSRAEMRDYLDLDLHIGITGWICDERRGLHLRDFLHEVPPERLMIETDAPYLLPRDIKPAPKDRRNEPAHLPHILATVAAAVRRPVPQVAAQTTAAARAFFRLPA
jgi:TatD DNase family protein